MPRVFGRGSRSRPAALVSDRDDAALFPAPVSGAARRWRAPESRAGRAPTLLRCLAPTPRSTARWPQRTRSTYQASSIDLIRQYRGAGIDPLINGDRNDVETPCTFRLGCHAPLGLTADAERPPSEEIMSIGGAHAARRGTGPTYLECPLPRGALYLILQNRISRGSGSPEIKLHRRGR